MDGDGQAMDDDGDVKQRALQALLAQLNAVVANLSREVESVGLENLQLKRNLVDLKSTVSFSADPAPGSKGLSVDVNDTSKQGHVSALPRKTYRLKLHENSESDNITSIGSAEEHPRRQDGVSDVEEKEEEEERKEEEAEDNEMRVVLQDHSANVLMQYTVKNTWMGHPEFFHVKLLRPQRSQRISKKFLENISSHVPTKEEPMDDVKESSSQFMSQFCIIHPRSRFRCFWVLLCLVLLMYDLVMVPVDVCFDLGDLVVTWYIDLFATIFWTLDILLTFLTGIVLPTHIELRMHVIAKTYARTYLPFDILIVVPDYITMSFEGFPGGEVSMLRMARWGRLMRLLRLARVGRAARLRPFVRMLAFRYHLSKEYVGLSQGWLGMTLGFVVCAHLLACLWHGFSDLIDSGWIHANGLEAADTFQRYVISAHWAYSRLCLTAGPRRIEATPDFIMDCCLMFLCFVIAALYIGQVTTVVFARVNSKPLSLWRLSLEYSRKYKISPVLDMRLTKVLEAEHYQCAGEVHAEEQLFLSSLPPSLRQELQFASRMLPLLHRQFFQDLIGCNARVVFEICNNGMSEEVVVETETPFSSGDVGDSTRFITSGCFQYTCRDFDDEESPIEGRSLSVQVQKPDVLSEAILWTDTEHLGTLCSITESTLQRLDAKKFAETIILHKPAFIHAVRYARHFVWQLNHAEIVDDLTRFDRLSIEVLNDGTFQGSDDVHFAFISHYKVEAGTEATLIHDLFVASLKDDEAHPAHNLRHPIFIDSEELVDLTRLKEHVQKSDILMILLTPGLLSRPYCLIEIATAVKENVSIVPVEIKRPGCKYQYPDEEFYMNFVTGKYLSDDSVALLRSEGITLEEMESAIRHVFQKIALHFSPHAAKVIRRAEINNILKRCDGEISKNYSEFLLRTSPQVCDS